MHITDKDIEQYLYDHTTAPSATLDEIERETYLKSLYPRMLSGKTQGRFLSMISRMVRPTNILEIGTFTGYSAICLCEGLQPDGLLHTIEINEELKAPNEARFDKARLSHKIKMHIGNALEIIPSLGIQFDLIFIDADKINYSNYYNLCIDKLATGGFMLVDNVLWGGKVTMKDKSDKDTIAVKAFNALVQQDDRVMNVMVPLRDGITLIQKIC